MLDSGEKHLAIFVILLLGLNIDGVFFHVLDFVSLADPDFAVVIVHYYVGVLWKGRGSG